MSKFTAFSSLDKFFSLDHLLNPELAPGTQNGASHPRRKPSMSSTRIETGTNIKAQKQINAVSDDSQRNFTLHSSVANSMQINKAVRTDADADTRNFRFIQMVYAILSLFNYVVPSTEKLIELAGQIFDLLSTEPVNQVWKCEHNGISSIVSLQQSFSFYVERQDDNSGHLCYTRINLCFGNRHPFVNYSILEFNKLRTQLCDFITRKVRASPDFTDDGNYNVDNHTFYAPYWFSTLLHSHAVMKMPDSLCTRTYSHMWSQALSLNDTIAWLNRIDPSKIYTKANLSLKLDAQLDRQIKHRALARTIEGKLIHRENLDRSLNRIDPNNTLNNARIEGLLHEIHRVSEEIVALRLDYRKEEQLLSEPCMEAPNEVAQTVDDSANTGIADTAIEYVTEITEKEPDNAYVSEIMTDIPHAYPDLTTRWQKIQSFTLDSSTTRGTTFLLHLPADFLSANWDSPNSLPFRTHEFFSGSMEIKLQWNIPKTNQFHVKVGFVYFWLQRDRRDELLEYGPVSQQPGGRLNGHISNSTIVKIPFMSYTPLIPINPNNYLLNQYYATLIIKAYTDYEVSTGGVTASQLNCYIKFAPDLKFYGQRQIQDAYPGFTPPAAHIDPVFSPPLISEPCMFAALGTSLLGTVKTTALGLTQNIAQSAVSAANDIVRTGVRTATGSLVGATENVLSRALPPKHNRDKPTDYHNVALHQRATTNLASGSGEFMGESFRLQTTGLTPHPDFLLGVEKYDNIETIIECFGFVNAVRWDVSTGSEVQIASFNIQPASHMITTSGGLLPPGISEWAPVDHLAGWFKNYHGQMQYKFELVSDGFKTGRLLVAYVPNATSEIPVTYEQARAAYFKTFDLGGDLDTQLTFTFDIPYIHNFANYPMSNNDLTNNRAGAIYLFCEIPISMPVNLVDHVDILVSRRAIPGSMKFAVPTTNFSSILQNVPRSVFQLNYRFNLRATVNSWSPISVNVEMFSPGGAPLGSTNVTGGGSVIIYNFANVALARSVKDSYLTWRNNVAGTRLLEVDILSTVVAGTLRISATLAFDTGAENWTVAYGDVPVNNYHAISFVEGGIQPTLLSNPCMDVRHDPLDEQTTVPPISVFHEGLIGENHMNLQDICRRFETTLNTNIHIPNGDNIPIFRLPVHFGFSSFRDMLARNYTTNKIGHLHDAMRFTRGGIRFYIQVSSNVQGTLKIYHEPQTQEYPFAPGDQKGSFLYDTGFGETILSLSQNNTVAVEVPLYNPNIAILNASYFSPERAVNFSQGLGTLNFTWTGQSAVTNSINLQVMRAFADDTQMYGFNGFPIREIFSPGFGPDVTFYNTPTHGLKPRIHSNPCMWVNMDNAALSVKETSDEMRELVAETKDFLNRMADSGKPTEVISTVIFQIGHLIVTPSLPHFILSTGQVLVSLRIFTFDFLQKIQDCLTNIWQFISQTGLISVPCAPEANADINAFSQFSGFIWSGMATMFSLSDSQKKTPLFERMSVSFSKAPLQSRITEFMKTLLHYIKDVATFICDRFFPESKLLRYLKEDKVADFHNAALIFTDDTIFNDIQNSVKAIAAVFKTIADGEEILNLLTRARYSDMQIQIITNVRKDLDALKKVRSKLAALASVPVVGYNPFCYYLAGPSSIGKSRLLKRVSIELINKVLKERFEGDPIYVVPTTEHWEAYTNQPVIHFDDFNRISAEQAIDSDANHLCGLKGEAPYTINYAFVKKGGVSLAKIIGCASNIAYPTQNGINSVVLQKRRNVCYKVIPDFTGFASCTLHPKIDLHCAPCKQMTDANGHSNLDRLSTWSYLQFQRYAPVEKEKIAAPQIMTYEEFMADILYEANAYHQDQIRNMAEEHEAKVQFGIPVDCETILPQSSVSAAMKQLSNEQYNNVVAELGGLRTKVTTPLGLINWVKNKWLGFEDEEEDLVYEYPLNNSNHSTCRHSTITPTTNFVFYKNGYRVDEEGMEDVTNLLCSPECTWDTVEPIIMNEIANAYAQRQELTPKHFPRIYSQDLIWIQKLYHQLLQQQTSKKKWRLVLETLATTTALVLTGIGMWKLSKTLFTTTPSSPEPELVKGRVEKHKHPCLMSSGDIKTKFISRFRSLHTRKSEGKKTVLHSKPKGDDDVSRLLADYASSVMMIKTYDGKYVSTSVCVSPGLLVTQLHSIVAILHHTTNAFNRLKKDYPNEILTEEQNNEIQRKICIHVEKRNASGEVMKKSYLLAKFLDMIEHTLGTDEEASDMIVLHWLDPDFQPRNVSRWLYDSEKDDNIDLRNCLIQDCADDRNGKTPLDSVTELDQVITYSAPSAMSWTGKAQSVDFNIIGFRTGNPFPGKEIGMCGSILVDCTNCKIIGLMSAGLSTELHFNAISNDIFAKAGAAATFVFNSRTPTFEQKRSKKIDVPVEDTKVFKSNPQMMVHHSIKTTIQPSIAHERFGPVKRAPCNLSQDGDNGQKAICSGLRHYVPHDEFPDRHVEAAYNHLKHQMVNYNIPELPVLNKRPLNEAVCGIPSYVPRIKLSTGVGMPWCTRSETSKKSHLLGFDDEHQLIKIHPELLEMIHREEELMEKGGVPLTIWQIALKDERLKLEKLDNVRLIQCSPLSLTISARKYLMDFNLAFQTNRRKLGHMVGINPLSLEWDELARELLSVSNNICVGDYSKFGPRLSNSFIKKAYALMADWYAEFGKPDSDNINEVRFFEACQRARESLGQRVVNSINIAFDQFFELECGSPSGAMNTAIINSMCNQFYIYCAWQGIMEEEMPEWSGLHHFNDNVCFYCYGDDVIFSVSDEAIGVFNNQSIHDYFTQYGVKYTDVMKGDEMRKYCTLEEATFLKFGFRRYNATTYDGGVWVCVPDEADLRDTINWVRKPKGTKNDAFMERVLVSACLMNCDDALRKMWFHGREKFNKFQNDVISFWRDVDKGRGLWVPKIYDFDALQLEYGIPLDGKSVIRRTVAKSGYDEEELEESNYLKSIAHWKSMSRVRAPDKSATSSTSSMTADSNPYESLSEDVSDEESHTLGVNRGAMSRKVDIPKNPSGEEPHTLGVERGAMSRKVDIPKTPTLSLNMSNRSSCLPE